MSNISETSNALLEELRGQRTLFDLDRQILQHNLYGVDLNAEAVQICQLSLWIKTAARGKRLTSLDHTIRESNSIMSDPGDTVIYRSRLNAKINRNFEVFTATDFLATITQQIPDKGAQMVRYYGWYSNKMRGVRHRGLPPDLVPRRPGLSPPPPLKLPSKRWRDLIVRVWHVDPLRCPVCQNPMRVIAVIEDPRLVEKILRHLSAWHDPPAGLSPPSAPGSLHL